MIRYLDRAVERFEISDEFVGMRLDSFLAQQMPSYSRTKLAKWVDAGHASLNGKPAASNHKLKRGEVLEVEPIEKTDPHDLSPADIPIDVVFEDDHMLIVNKPRGLATHPAASLKEPSLVNALLGRNLSLSSVGEEYRPGIVHRLDKETTGLLVIAKTDAAHVHLAQQIERKTAIRRYFAIVAGDIEREKFTIDAPMARDPRNRQLMTVNSEGKAAITHVFKVARVTEGTLIACRLETGRTHQIRVHLSAIGHPVIGDALYAPRAYQSGPMQLHAAYLSVEHPVSGETIRAFSAPPEDFYAHELAVRAAIEN